jgi:branched-chain amino acid aminotransferase
MSRKAFAASDAEWAYHGGELVRVGDIRLSPATHALNYGTGVFEGIRAYWSEGRGTLQVLKMREHYERFERSCRLLRIELTNTVDELCEVTLEILRRNAPRQDTYVRPLAYKAAESVGVNLKGETELSIFTVPMGNYVELTGLRVCVSSWRRTPDNAIPARAKVTGIYVNSALAEEYLVPGRPFHFGGWVRMLDRRLYPAWGRLTEAVRDGRYIDATREVLQKHGALWFLDESYVISRKRD